MNGSESTMNRRSFLRAAAGTLVGAGLGSSAFAAADEEYDFLMARVKFQCNMKVRDNWNVFPGGERNLLSEFASIVRCRVKLPPDCNDNLPHSGRDEQFNAVVDLTDARQLRRYPFLFMTASGSYTLSKDKKDNLLQYAHEGGFLYMDDCVCGINDDKDYFYRSSYTILQEVFGQEAVKDVPTSHEIFHNVFDLGRIGLPHIIGQYHSPKGVFIKDRLAVLLTSTDIHCGWVDRTGQWFGTGGKMGIGKHGHREAIMMGVNILMYALSH